MKGEAVDLSVSRGADNTDLLGVICTFSNYDQPTDYTNAKGQVQFIHVSPKRDGKTSRSPDDSCRKNAEKLQESASLFGGLGNFYLFCMILYVISLSIAYR